ncbi:MAG: hypothetical protein CM15mP117_04130 [Alphaproteobacteria bacterium]|nr:MAG: hypothetical protein CM15mP117_04130 [Alphaproteobacteria bacterium]
MDLIRSIHIQVGAEEPLKEAIWIDDIINNHPDWNMKQVVFCDLTKSEMRLEMEKFEIFTISSWSKTNFK